MKTHRHDRIKESKEWGKLSVTPECVFRIDKDKEFGDFTHLSGYLDTIIQSKLDLIALLHFSDLKTIKTQLFFTLSGINTKNLLDTSQDASKNVKKNIKKIKDQILREQVRDHF